LVVGQDITCIVFRLSQVFSRQFDVEGLQPAFNGRVGVVTSDHRSKQGSGYMPLLRFHRFCRVITKNLPNLRVRKQIIIGMAPF